MKLLSILALVLVSACSAVQPKASVPQTATVQEDGGTLLCEYIRVTAAGKSFDAGVCAEDAASLEKAVQMFESVYPLVERLAK